MAYSAAVITVSDKGSRGEREDTSGPALCEILTNEGYDVQYTSIVPDEKDQIKAELLKCADELNIALILTTGGTGFSPRDITPEATLEVVERQTPGIPEAMRAESMKITPHGCLSREAAGIRGRSLIINLPGSKKASTENFSAVVKPVAHGLKMLYSEGSAECAAQAEVNGADGSAHGHDHGSAHDNAPDRGEAWGQKYGQDNVHSADHQHNHDLSSEHEASSEKKIIIPDGVKTTVTEDATESRKITETAFTDPVTNKEHFVFRISE